MIPVGHRALVAYERDDGQYDLHYSHWGAYEWQLVDALGPGVRFGQSVAVSDCQFDRKQQAPTVDPTPIARNCSFEDILTEQVDFQQYEALYRVSESFAIQPYLVCWFGFPSAGEVVPRAGVLMAVDSASPRVDGSFLRGWFEGTKEAVADLLDTGALTVTAARSRLLTRVRCRIGDNRDVLLGPALDVTEE